MLLMHQLLLEEDVTVKLNDFYCNMYAFLLFIYLFIYLLLLVVACGKPEKQIIIIMY
jgi:hypothetical protein